MKQLSPEMAPAENSLAPLHEFTTTKCYPCCTFTADNDQHNFTVQASYGKYEVKVSISTGYGTFEHVLYEYDSGAVYFDKGHLAGFHSTTLRLPRDVIYGLRAAGFVVPQSFE